MIIKCEVKDRSILDALRRIQARADDLTPVMHEIGSEVRTLIHLGFNAERDPWGKPWKPIKRQGKILRDTGRLLNSITYRLTGKNGVEVGTNVEYGIYHQFGTFRRRKDGAGGKSMPARRFLPIGGTRDAPYANLPPEWERSITSILKEAIAT